MILSYTLAKVEAEVLVVTQVDMLAEVKVQLIADSNRGKY